MKVGIGRSSNGSTENKEKRLPEHNKGKVAYSKGRRPWKIIYYEEYKTRTEARKRELFLKSNQGEKIS
jgi:putative endonuclease